jgi:thiol-disulfide isomerase/thioredoxin
MKARYLILILILLIFSIVSGQEVTIRGRAKCCRNKPIKLTSLSDQLTYTEKTIGGSNADSAGIFIIKANISEPLKAFLYIGRNKSEMYIEPGKEYDITLTPVNNTAFNPYQQEANLNLEINNTTHNDLNSLIRVLNLVCNDFVLNNFEILYKQRNRKVFKKFSDSITNVYRNIENKYFADYLNYKLGYIEYMSRLSGSSETEKKYFHKKPVLYNNTAYMDFFNELYSKHFASSSFTGFEELNEIINNNGSFESFYALLKKDTMLSENTFCELVMLKELGDLYHSKGYSKDKILYIIKDAEVKLIKENNRTIARNLYMQLTKMTPGSPAPAFSLKDIYGSNFSNKSFKGKYIYISFFRTDIPDCIMELNVINALYENYKDNIEFINISADDDIKILATYLEENKKAKGIYLYINNDTELLDNYKVRSYPAFVFISPDMYILNYPAPKPSEGIKNIFEKELKKTEKK